MFPISYPFSHIEQAIERFYSAHDLVSPIDPEEVAQHMQIAWQYADADSVSDTERHRIVIDATTDPLTQREDFAHEIAHILLHCGSQYLLPDLFVELQERQASQLSLHLLVPSHLLLPKIAELSLQSSDQIIGAIASLFHVSLPFAKRRYQKLMAQVNAIQFQTALEEICQHGPQCGRDYDQRLTIGDTEYFYFHGGVVFTRQLVES